MEVHFCKSKPKQNASVTLPSSKSLSHRALITAALAEGDSFIEGIDPSKDTEATINVLEHFGVSFEEKENGILVHGCGGKIVYDLQLVDCNESGSTLRFLIPIAALQQEEVTFTGHGKLLERPQSVYEEIFNEKNLFFYKDHNQICLRGPLQGGSYTLKGNVSSQFISGLLFALPLCREDSIIHILPPFESASYVTLTLDALKKAGIQAEMDEMDIRIKGSQTYQPIHTRVEGDDSQTAFFAELACISAVPLKVLNLNHDSHQGDHVILDIIRSLGGKVEEIENGYAIEADQLRACQIDLADCPDLGPALFALASQCEGTTVFHHCERLRIKESDRIACMEEELKKLGCQIESDGGEVRVTGKTAIRDHVILNGHNDHRIVMALSILATLANDITIIGAEAVEKSYPQFFNDLRKLGIQYD